jgi:DNA-binding transcriptional regulator YhcF (GntR family)
MAEPAGAARIVAALRSRIMSGELAPGDRVPSTRELTREWGVAMATATKALSTLRHEGLVQPIAGVGTVVAETSATARARTDAEPHDALTAEAIVAAAVRVADVEGIEAVSMRRVASELGAAAMSLYRHVGDKDDLVLRMQDAVLAEWSPPMPPPLGWRPRLEIAATALWVAFRTHPWLPSVLSLSRPRPIHGGLMFTEWCLAALEGTPLSLPEAFDVQMILFNFVRGVAMSIEDEVDAMAATGVDIEEWIDSNMPAFHALVASGEFPTLERMFAIGYDLDLDAMVRNGLDLLLDGFTVRLRRAERLGSAR